jgi:ubiquinone/menaquinone biosynthesis C-methylase UbiE
VTGIWEREALPRLMNVLLASGEVDRHRREATRGLEGAVLEIGFGSGRNVPFYPPEVGEVFAVDPSGVGRKLAAKRVAATTIPIRFVGLDAQQIPLDDDRVDAALCTFTLCTVPDATAALREVRRVLRPGGRLHFLEHGLAADPAVAARQHRLNGMQRRLFGGCHLDRPIDRLVEGAGLEIAELDTGWMRAPAVMRPWNYLYTGVASRSD